MSGTPVVRVYQVASRGAKADTLELKRAPRKGRARQGCRRREGMAEFVIKLADERGRVQEQVQTAATAEELRARFAHAGYHVFRCARAAAWGCFRGAR